MMVVVMTFGYKSGEKLGRDPPALRRSWPPREQWRCGSPRLGIAAPVFAGSKLRFLLQLLPAPTQTPSLFHLSVPFLFRR